MDSGYLLPEGRHRSLRGSGAEFNGAPSPQAEGACLAQALYRLRRRRERLFSCSLFSEPSWDMLLDLHAAERSGKRVSITSACIAASAPTTTALRCLKQLQEEGLVRRDPDPSDARRTYVRLSEDALADMDSLFQDLFRCL